MKSYKLGMLTMMLVAGLTGCNADNSASSAGGDKAAAAAPSGKAIEFVDTQESKPLVIDAALFDTPAAKEFLATGNNPYIGNEEAIAKGKKSIPVVLLYAMPWPGSKRSSRSWFNRPNLSLS